MRVGELVISEAIAEKLAVKHGVSMDEVEEAWLYRPAHEQVWRREKGGTLRLFAQSLCGKESSAMGIRVVPDGQHEWSEALRREVDRLDTPGCLTVGSYLYDPMTPPFAGEQECDNHIAPWAATERHAVRW